jgi:hypothetical protein
MRRPLLTLLALLLLLMQPVALLHALSHGAAGVAHAIPVASVQGAPADADHAHVRTGLDCLQCLAFAAIGSAALPAALLMFRAPLLRHAAPEIAGRLPRGGTGAGYHARGPPALA